MASLLAVLAAVAALAAGAGWLAHRLRLPPALGYLAVGAVASPAFKATASIDQTLLAPTAEVGILVFLFVLGLALDLKRLRHALRAGALVLPLDVLVPGLVVAGAVRFAGWSLVQSIALGLCVGVSSTLFGERLTNLPGFGLEARKRTLGVLVAEDVAAVAMLAVMSLLGASGGPWFAPVTEVGRLLILFVALAAASLLLVPRLLDAVARTHTHELMVLVTGATVAAVGWLGAWAGSAELGALVAGVAAAEAGSRFAVRNALQGLRDLAVAIFFFAAGLGMDVGQAAAHPWFILGIAFLFLVCKLIVHIPAALAGGLELPDAIRSAAALGTVGEFSLILAGSASLHGIAHPLLPIAVIGAMLVLAVAAPLILATLPFWVRLVRGLPESIRKPLWLAIQGARRLRPATPSREVRVAVRVLSANLLLLAAWIVLAVAVEPLLEGRLTGPWTPAVLFGLAAVIAAPIAFAAYRRYRDLVHLVVRGEGGAVRARLVDAWVAASAVLLFLPLILLAPRTLPVLAGGILLAIAVAAIAWRQLNRFQRALEASVARVLGHDSESSPLLDRLLEKYPWGVRVTAVSVPAASPVANHSLAETRLFELSGATLAVIQRHRREIVNPAPHEVIRAGDTLVLMGDEHQIARAEALIVAHGEALRLLAQSRLANLEEVIVGDASDLVGRPLGLADVAGRTGSRIVGLWVTGAQHPEPFRDDLVAHAGDRLIVLGSPLQVQRARLLAEGVSS